MEDLIALNDEMAALVRAGIPLEQGLTALGGDLPRRPARLVEQLSARMDAGENLSQILADDQRFPPVWRAVVQAGLRSGRLATALESLSETARRIAEMRKLVGAGLVYPLIVLVLAYALFVFLIVGLAPLAFRVDLDMTRSSDWLLAGLNRIGQTARWWAIPVPLAAAFALLLWWRRLGYALWSGRSVLRRRGWRGPGIRRAIYNGRMASFAEVLAMLIRQQVSLHESLALAAQTSGDRALVDAANQLAKRLERGELPSRREDLPQGFPPLVGWLLLSSSPQGDLGGALHRSAEVYRQRAARAAAWSAVYMPLLLTVFVGGTATLVCGLLAFGPLIRMFYHLTWPIR